MDAWIGSRPDRGTSNEIGDTASMRRASSGSARHRMAQALAADRARVGGMGPLETGDRTCGRDEDTSSCHSVNGSTDNCCQSGNGWQRSAASAHHCRRQTATTDWMFVAAACDAWLAFARAEDRSCVVQPEEGLKISSIRSSAARAPAALERLSSLVVAAKIIRQ